MRALVGRCTHAERSFPRRICAVALLGLLASCSSSTPGDVVVEVMPAEATRPPEHILLSWLDAERFIFRDRRVPEAGRLEPRSTGELAVVHVSVGRSPQTIRRVIVRGLRGGEIVGEGAAEVEITPGQPVTVQVLLREGRLPDVDENGIPDEVDVCLGTRIEGGLCLRNEHDAATTDVAVQDAAVPTQNPDGSADRAGGTDGMGGTGGTGIADAGAMDRGPMPMDARPPLPPDAAAANPDGAAPAPNLITNPSFEEGAAGWNAVVTSADAASVVSPGRTDRFHLHETVKFGWWQQTIAKGSYTPGRTYRLTGWAKTNVPLCRIGVKGGRTTSSNFETVLDGFGTDWRSKTETFTIRPDATWLVVFVYVGDRAGDCHVDDLAITAE